jgi:hypothetical protein
MILAEVCSLNGMSFKGKLLVQVLGDSGISLLFDWHEV